MAQCLAEYRLDRFACKFHIPGLCHTRALLNRPLLLHCKPHWGLVRKAYLLFERENFYESFLLNIDFLMETYLTWFSRFAVLFFQFWPSFRRLPDTIHFKKLSIPTETSPHPAWSIFEQVEKSSSSVLTPFLFYNFSQRMSDFFLEPAKFFWNLNFLFKFAALWWVFHKNNEGSVTNDCLAPEGSTLTYTTFWEICVSVSRPVFWWHH